MNPKPNLIDDRSFRNDLLLARPDAAFPLPNEHVYSSLYGREMELMRKIFKTEPGLEHAMHNYGNSGNGAGNTSGGGAGGNCGNDPVTNLHNKFEKSFSPGLFPLAGAVGPSIPAPYGAGPGAIYFDVAHAHRFQDHEAVDAAKDNDIKPILFPPPPGYPFAQMPPMVRIGGARKLDDESIIDGKVHPSLLKPLYNERKQQQQQQQHQQQQINLNYLHKTKSSLHKPPAAASAAGNFRAMASECRGYDNMSPTHTQQPETLATSQTMTAAGNRGAGFMHGPDSDDFVSYNFNVNNYDTHKNQPQQQPHQTQQPSPSTSFLSSQMNHVNNSSHMNKNNHNNNSNSQKGNNNHSNNNDYYYYNDVVEFNLNKSLKSDIPMADYEMASARNSPSISPRAIAVNKVNISGRQMMNIGGGNGGNGSSGASATHNTSKDTAASDDEDGASVHHHPLAGQSDASRSTGGKSQPDDIDDERIDRDERDDEFMNL